MCRLSPVRAPRNNRAPPTGARGADWLHGPPPNESRVPHLSREPGAAKSRKWHPMEIITGLTFDDVLLVPGASDILPSDANL